jgi:UDP-N-acetylmuramoyl-tripeptide--D-alanyl-D-alanine ligase
MQTEFIYEKYLLNPVVSTDTRKIEKNSLFFALKGANFNGNEFAEQALNSGASYAVIDERKYQLDERFILVEDVLSALQDLAKHHRKNLTIPIIGITGSNGKTTSKELIHAVLQTTYHTFATIGNFNNHIGVPLSLLSINNQHEMAIIEMGANHVNEIAFLSSLCNPDFGLITNIGKAHLEGFGSFENIIKGKCELYDHIKKNNGKLFVNPNNSILVEKSNDISRIFYITEDIKLNPSKEFLSISYQGTLLNTNLVGEYNFENVLSAITIGSYFKVSKENIIKAIASYIPENNRSQLIEKGTNKIILDAYNANPVSMEMAITNFNKIKSSFKIAIIGAMKEMGDYCLSEHQKLVELLEKSNIDKIYIVGSEFNACKINRSNYFNDTNQLKQQLNVDNIQQSHVLIKGSRGMKLETLLDVFS